MKCDMSVLFSKVELWSDNGNECELFVGGIPREYEDLENADDFQEFLDFPPDANEITAYVTSFIYGDGESEAANETQLAEIKEHFEEPEWSEKLDLIEKSSFTFDYDTDELCDMEQEL